VSAQVVKIHRFPVKSMLGESPADARLDNSGVVGDRAHALIDVETGKVASAKVPRRWAVLLGYRAAYVGDASPGAAFVVELPDGTRLASDDRDVDARLSSALGREVRLVATPPADAVYDDLWPDVEGIAPDEFINETRTSTSDDGRPISTLPVGLLAPGTFQDLAPLTIMTVQSLRHAARLQPDSRWDVRRFRPNLLLDLDDDSEGFIENDWTGRRIAIGETTIEVFAATPRCVMTTLAQDDLPADREVLRTVAQHNRVEVPGAGRFACLGAYASVVEAGPVAVGSPVRLL
jgi:uncharacterized protein YcbX